MCVYIYSLSWAKEFEATLYLGLIVLTIVPNLPLCYHHLRSLPFSCCSFFLCILCLSASSIPFVFPVFCEHCQSIKFLPLLWSFEALLLAKYSFFFISGDMFCSLLPDSEPVSQFLRFCYRMLIIPTVEDEEHTLFGQSVYICFDFTYHCFLSSRQQDFLCQVCLATEVCHWACICDVFSIFSISKRNTKYPSKP